MKMSLLKTVLSLSLILLYFPLIAQEFTADQHLWFEKPSESWSKEALHIGNGYFGASLSGDMECEHIVIAEKTFWTGGPHSNQGYNFGINPGGKQQIGNIRKLLQAGDFSQADQLSAKYMVGNAKGYGYFSKVGQLLLDFKHKKADTRDYRRYLDLQTAQAGLKYTHKGVAYSRAYFCSYPDKVLAVNLQADALKSITLDVSHPLVYQASSSTFQDDVWTLKGTIEGSGLQYCIRIWVQAKGGTTTFNNQSVSIDQADQVTLYYTVETEYQQNYPTYKGNDPQKGTAATIAKLKKRDFQSTQKIHIDDYQRIYNRASLTLAGDPQYDTLATDQRIRSLKMGNIDDSSLKALFFNFSRYLIISASREKTLPSNLQGTWNNFEKAPWNGNYQSNINLQEMYWSTGPTNIPEANIAYINWIKDIYLSGKKTASEYYGTEGWVSHSVGNIWGYTAPGQDILWGLYPSGSAWHCKQLWDHYLYTQDKKYLKEILPIMKDAALFYLNNLMDYQGYLLMAPSVSAEHGVEFDQENRPLALTTKNGESGGQLLTVPSFQDIIMIKNLFVDVQKALHELDFADSIFDKRLADALDKMYPVQIGRYGQLQEWVIDVDNPRNHHRHIAHLYGLFPGDLYSMSKTPAIAQAIKKSLQLRGYGKKGSRWPHAGGNWSMIWRSALWTKLMEADVAMDIFNTMIAESGYPNLCSEQSGNFQVDATMATAAVFSNMLVQYEDDILHILPALPSEWPTGACKGIVSRGMHQVDISWENGKLLTCTITLKDKRKFPKIYVLGKAIAENDPRVVWLHR